MNNEIITQMGSLPQQLSIAKDLDVIEYFNLFVVKEFGQMVWDQLLKSDVNGFKLSYLIHLYGDIALQDAVIKLSELVSVTIFDLLQEFAEFHNSQELPKFTRAPYAHYHVGN